MIKPGKACSQLMEANNTGATKIKVVEKLTHICFLLSAGGEAPPPDFIAFGPEVWRIILHQRELLGGGEQSYM
jgi:hypothetical protein